VALVGLAVRRRTERLRPLLVAVFAASLVVSLALSRVLTQRGSPWAFFSLPTRWWEFAAAGLLATLPVPRALRAVPVRTAVAAVGAVLLVGASVRLRSTTPYPGTWALVPVAGTYLLILAGETWGGAVAPTPIARALAVRPMQWVGRVSYS